MKHEVIGICPVCGKNLSVTKLSCHTCHTDISGDFALSKFSLLSKDELNFVETFIKVGGNLKEMEKELSLSYPTLKKNLDALIVKLGLGSSVVAPKVDDADILQRLKNKEISVDEAAILLKKG